MKNFTFHNPTKVIFGDGTVEQIGDEAEAFGKRLMLVYGKSSIKKSGLFDRVIASLKKSKIDIVEYPGVKPNPVLSHTNKGIELAKKENVDFILAAGGGSVIDEAKAIAAGAKTEGDVWDFFTGAAAIQAALPVLVILTIPATGSEMNGGTVITKDESMEKLGFVDPHLSPRVSIMDPTVTYTVSPAYTAYSAVDAISHLIEGYFTHSDEWAPIQDRYVEGLVKTIMESTERCLRDPEDYQGRATFMWAATLAWNGLGTAGVGDFSVPMHLLEHPLSGIYDIAHGAGLSITIPAWLMYTFEKGRYTAKFVRFAKNVFGIEDESGELSAEKGIRALKDWFEKIGSPTSLTEVNIPAADIGMIADNTRSLAEVWGMKEYTKDVIIDLYNQCVGG
jgi:alcohol dehydrogenase YqhD (iron-dependent ADH family)